MARKGSDSLGPSRIAHLGKPQIASAHAPTRPSLSEPFRTDLNLSEAKTHFSNRSPLCSKAFSSALRDLLVKESFTAVCAYPRQTALICGSALPFPHPIEVIRGSKK